MNSKEFKRKVLNTPFLGVLIKSIRRKRKTFDGSKKYWESRYEQGGNSGGGSYSHLAQFKAEVINKFVSDFDIYSVIEFGCGDGNQLKLAEYKEYIGFDVSDNAIDRCLMIFSNDSSKKFKNIKKYNNESADLVLSLDVIFHLVEDIVFEDYMNRLFSSSNRFVIIYSSNHDADIAIDSPHVRHRFFSKWIDDNMKNWSLIDVVKNKYPYNGDDMESSFADFFIYKKTK